MCHQRMEFKHKNNKKIITQKQTVNAIPPSEFNTPLYSLN